MAAGLGELFLAALALKALGEKPAQAPPPPPTVPDQGAAGGGGGGNDGEKIAEIAGGAAGTILTAVIGAIGGGGSAAGTGSTALAGGAAGGIVGGGAGGGVAAGEGAGAGVGAFAASGITAGGAFAMAWAAFYILQFIMIDMLNNARVGWIRYRDEVYDLNVPLHHLQSMELSLVSETLRQLGLTDTRETATEVSDSRLTVRLATAQDLQIHYTTYPGFRKVLANPFPLRQRLPSAAQLWTFLQMAARVVAARYVIELGKFARDMIANFPGLGGQLGSDAYYNPFTEVWGFELVGGGLPTESYASFADKLRAAQAGGTVNGVTFDDILRSARLAALFRVVSVIAHDPGINSPWNPAKYSFDLYKALGLSPAVDHITYGGNVWFIDTAFYKVPCRALWLDIDELKRGTPLHPFLNGQPMPHNLTSLRATA